MPEDRLIAALDTAQGIARRRGRQAGEISDLLGQISAGMSELFKTCDREAADAYERGLAEGRAAEKEHAHDLGYLQGLSEGAAAERVRQRSLLSNIVPCCDRFMDAVADLISEHEDSDDD